MKWIYSTWWKWLCVIMLIYVVIGGLLVPLGPGITRVSPVAIRTDSLYKIDITAYHAHFTSTQAGKVQVWFKHKNSYYEPATLQIKDANNLQAEFAVSSLQQHEFIPSSFDVVINNNIDGTFALRDALTLVKSKSVDSLSQILLHAVEPEVVNNRTDLFCFPYREILYETIRNTFFHVPMWFTMTMLVFFSCISSIIFLTGKDKKYDIAAHQSVIAALLFGACGYLTGLVWAKYTWYVGVAWGDVLRKLLLEDIKMAAALVSIFFYIAYLVIRSSFDEETRKAKISAVYNVFAFVIFILCVFVIPRLTDSMHPGNGGNPAFSKYDLDSTLRMFFYPAVIGWILLGFWVLSILIRIQFVTQKRQS